MSTARDASASAMGGTSTPDVRWLLVVQLYAAVALWSVVQLVTINAALHWLLGAFMASAASLWVVLDARRRNQPIYHAIQLLVFAFWYVAVPIYLIYSRGMRGLGWLLLHALGLVLASWVGMMAAAYFVNRGIG